jgi:hypothetical protein
MQRFTTKGTKDTKGKAKGNGEKARGAISSFPNRVWERGNSPFLLFSYLSLVFLCVSFVSFVSFVVNV